METTSDRDPAHVRQQLRRLGARSPDYVEHRLWQREPEFTRDDRSLLRAVVDLYTDEPDLFDPQAAFNLKLRRSLLKRRGSA
jgi:hypothetical protein